MNEGYSELDLCPMCFSVSLVIRENGETGESHTYCKNPDCQTRKFMEEAKEIREGDIRRAEAESHGIDMDDDSHLAQYDDDPNPYHGTYSEE
jgi:hypothetical protein